MRFDAARVLRLASLGILLAIFGSHAFAASAEPTAAAAGGGGTGASHHLTVASDVVRRNFVEVPFTHAPLVREDGVSTDLRTLMDDPRPVFVDFIYTTCTAICPIMSSTFQGLQDSLGTERDSVRLLSFSIDPEQDTPRRLRDFRHKYDAGEEWHFYTGSLEASVAAQRAFGVFTGDKMLHAPVTLYRAAPGTRWVRFDGFVTPRELLAELPPRDARRP